MKLTHAWAALICGNGREARGKWYRRVKVPLHAHWTKSNGLHVRAEAARFPEVRGNPILVCDVRYMTERKGGRPVGMVSIVPTKVKPGDIPCAPSLPLEWW